MKNSFYFLLIVVGILYSWTAYLFINKQISLSVSTGNLSDVADEVIAIPLETHPDCLLQDIQLIQRDGNNIFLISNQRLYHFNSSGQFLGVIASPTLSKHPIAVVDYTLDPTQNRIIVIGAQKEIHYYNYEEQLTSIRQLPSEKIWTRFGHISYYDQSIWTTIDLIQTNEEEVAHLEQWLYQFNENFQIISRRKLQVADVGRMEVNYKAYPEIAVHAGRIYTQAPMSLPAQILNDTLYLIQRNQLTITHSYNQILPLQIGSRFLLSTYYHPLSPLQSYTFCYDQKKAKAYQVKGGLTDDYYQTGEIPHLQSLDLQSQWYSYYKRGKEIQQAFPERSEAENPVLFIVKIKA